MPENKQEVEIILSHDGSHTLSSKRFGVTYHSNFGAIEESLTVFLSAGFHALRLRGWTSIRIFEMGFGTGLNALLSKLEADQFNLPCYYHGIEAYPISPETAAALNYPTILNRNEEANLFLKMHESSAEKEYEMSQHFTFKKSIDTIENYEFKDRYNLIYFDAFAPTAQPELWNVDLLKKLYDHMEDGGVLVTYCAKGQFKRDLKALGFEVEALPGPGKKREMTRAWKVA